MKPTRADRSLAILLVVTIVLVSLLSQALGGEREEVDGSVASTAPAGRRALYLMLADLGFEPQAWRQAPGALLHGDHLLWLAAAPEPWTQEKADATENARAGEEEEEEEEEEEDAEPARDTTPAALDLHALAHYRDFVEEGGTLVTEHNEESGRFLADVLGFDAVRRLALAEGAPAGTWRVRDAAGVELEAGWGAGGVFERLDPGDSARELWFGAHAGGAVEESERPLAVVLPIGNGRLVLLGDDGFLDNARIGEHDHALLAIRLIEELAPAGRVLFDEYALGAWETPGAVELALSPAIVLVTLHLLFLLVLFVWRLAWVRSFPRDPEALARVSPLARARALASVLVRARRYDLLARDLRRAALAGLRARGRITIRRSKDATHSSDETAASAAAAEERARDERDLELVAGRLGRTADLARWREVLLLRQVRDEAAFEALVLDLAQLETGVEVQARTALRVREPRSIHRVG